MEEIEKPAEEKTVDDPRINLLLAVQRNVFFDAVLASMAYTLLEEAFKQCQELREYKYDDIDLSTLTPATVGKYNIETSVITEVPENIGEILYDVDKAADIIAEGIKSFLYNDEARGVKCVAGTLRIHLVPYGSTGDLDIHVTAVKHTVEEK